jgi:hypothetical protein
MPIETPEQRSGVIHKIAAISRAINWRMFTLQEYLAER